MHQGSPDALLAAIAQSGNETTQGWMRLMAGEPAGAGLPPWLAELQAGAAQEGAHLAELQAAYLAKQTQLWSTLVAGHAEGPGNAAPADRRFASGAWRENPYFDYLRRSYLLAAGYVEDLVEAAPLEPALKERARFAARQWIAAMSPANFPATNPEAIQKALETGGESLTRGLAHLLEDARKGRISQTDESAFEVGRNIAVTPGEVVYENELIQLIQYAPATAQVARRPLVVVPPCINKFYILDLQPGSSLVEYAVAGGQSVFMISWRNAGTPIGHLGWDDYLEQGVFAALRVAREIAGADQVNALGFCVGGTLLGAALAVLAARGETPVASATFLASMHDFREPGQLGLFIDEAGVAAREAAIGRNGILPGAELAFVFSSLRANDLIWPYVVNNYLKGERPPAFDLLYWNSDSTNLPGPMYCYYVRNMYLENKLRVPGALVNCGVPVDLGKVALPAFILAAREDHIVPWRSAYRSLGLLRGEKTFVLAASGHVAGVVNPATKNRRSYWTAKAAAAQIPTQFPDDPDDWLAAADEHRGSWWPRWMDWLEAHSGGKRRAPVSAGTVQHRPIEPAPGRYVREPAAPRPAGAYERT
ncbi:MAG TPA: class I poly(R)-hydroxyalkanoic acid synthase [Burkholderiales bacterium]|nr:class I poly(R)-hydroxyalkanoic acid synthase [Burkholderiales bacterium]